MIEVNSLTFSYGPAHDPIFSNFSIRLELAGIYALLGFSGSGKSTLLKLLGRALQPCLGEVLIAPLRGIGYVPQESSLLPWITVRRNLELGAELLGQAEDQSWRGELIASCALEPFLDHRPRALSGGMKQRVAVISALTSGANVLLLDEPFAGSDRVRKSAMIDGIRSFIDRVSGGIALLTTHDPGDVFALGATAIWIDSLTRQPTVIAPVGHEWGPVDRQKLVDLMIRETT